jgi:hypothetical protein
MSGTPLNSTLAQLRTNVFDRLMFRLLVPGLILPFVLAVTTMVISTQPVADPSGNSTDRTLFSFAIAVFFFVQLGSQVLSGWFLLRRPASFAERTLPRPTGVLYAISYGFQLAWLGVIIVDLTSPLGIAFALALAGISTMIGLTLHGTKTAQRTANAPAISTLRVGRGSRIALVSYLTASAIAVGLWLVGKVLPAIAPLLPIVTADRSSFTGLELSYILNAISLIIIVFLGLPWSHTLLGFVLVAAFLPFTGLQVNTGGATQWIDAVLVLPVVANATLAIILLRSETHRVRLVNWFFRLKTAD